MEADIAKKLRTDYRLQLLTTHQQENLEGGNGYQWYLIWMEVGLKVSLGKQ